MSQTSDQLMKQLHFIMRASRYYMMMVFKLSNWSKITVQLVIF